MRDASEADIDRAMSRLNKINNTTGGESVSALRTELQHRSKVWHY
jgi:succinate dehydrogenase / fumarate reductase flavoprotein subunit